MIDQFPEWPANAKASDINIWVDNGYAQGMLYINIKLRNDPPGPTLKLVYCVNCCWLPNLDSFGVALP